MSATGGCEAGAFGFFGLAAAALGFFSFFGVVDGAAAAGVGATAASLMVKLVELLTKSELC